MCYSQCNNFEFDHQSIIVAFDCGPSSFYLVYFTRNGMEYTRLKKAIFLVPLRSFFVSCTLCFVWVDSERINGAVLHLVKFLLFSADYRFDPVYTELCLQGCSFADNTRITDSTQRNL
jgi:hypothetical protein